MKFLYLLIAPLVLFSCTSETKPEQTEVKPTEETKVAELNFDWLTGYWTDESENGEDLTFERWSKIDDTNYKGFACVIVAKDTVFKEDIRLYKNDTTWHFAVKGYEDEKETIFNLKNSSETALLVENENNPFPKQIQYYMSGEKLMARISGGGDPIDFEYDKN